MKLADLQEVQNLPVRDKLQLVDDLWLSMAAQISALNVSDEEKTLMDERWASFLKDPDSALTLEQFQEKMRALRGWSDSVSSRRGLVRLEKEHTGMSNGDSQVSAVGSETPSLSSSSHPPVRVTVRG